MGRHPRFCEPRSTDIVIRTAYILRVVGLCSHFYSLRRELRTWTELSQLCSCAPIVPILYCYIHYTPISCVSYFGCFSLIGCRVPYHLCRYQLQSFQDCLTFSGKLQFMNLLMNYAPERTVISKFLTLSSRRSLLASPMHTWSILVRTSVTLWLAIICGPHFPLRRFELIKSGSTMSSRSRSGPAPTSRAQFPERIYDAFSPK